MLPFLRTQFLSILSTEPNSGGKEVLLTIPARAQLAAELKIESTDGATTFPPIIRSRLAKS